MPEELALEELLGDRRARDRHEGLLGATALVVDRLRDHVLARAALARDEDGRRLAGGDAADELVELAHGRRLADDRAEPRALARLLAGDLHFVPEGGRLEGLLDAEEELLGLEGLLDVVLGSELDRLDGVLERGVGRHDDRELLGVSLADLAEEPEAVRVREPHVHEDEIPLVLECLPCFDGSPGPFRDIPLADQALDKRLVQNELILNDENLL